VHQLARIDHRSRQGPREAFRGGKLHRRAAIVRVAPEADKTANAPRAPAQALDLYCGVNFAPLQLSHALSSVDQPFHEDARLGIRQTARERVILQNVVEQRLDAHERYPPPPGLGRVRRAKPPSAPHRFLNYKEGGDHSDRLGCRQGQKLDVSIGGG
jgi:hypothetical protein